MASLIASIVSKTTATIEKVSSLAVAASYASKTVASEVLLLTKTKAEYLTGIIFVSANTIYQEIVNISEIVGRLFGKNLQDQLNVTDSSNLNTGKNPVDQTTVTDVLDRTVVFSREVVDQADISESDVIDFTKNHGDQVSVLESSNINVGKNSIDQFNITDVLDRLVQFSRNLTDQANISETRILDFNKDLADSAQLSDIISILVQTLYTFQHNFNVTDSLDRNVQFSRDFTDQSNITDVLALLMSFSRAATDQANISESNLVDFNKDLSDPTQLSDSIAIILQILYSIQDNLSISDTLTRTVAFSRDFIDPVNVTDDINGAAVDDDQVASFFKVTGDQFNLADTAENVFNKQPQDGLSISNPGIILNQDYSNGPDYFLEDYVGVSRTIT